MVLTSLLFALVSDFKLSRVCDFEFPLREFYIPLAGDFKFPFVGDFKFPFVGDFEFPLIFVLFSQKRYCF